MINLFNKLTHLLDFKINKELKEIYTSVAFRAFAFGLVGIFIPVYLYNLGYSLTNIFLFYIFFYISYIVFSFVSSILSRYFGVKHLMFLSIPPVLVFFILLIMLKYYIMPLWVLGLILGISSSFYWIGYHLEFAKFSDPRYRGREVGLANIVGSVLSIFAPAIGGLLIVAGGFVALFIVVLLVFILSIIPLFMSADIFPKKNIMFFKVFRKRSIRYDILPYIAEGVLGVAYADVWPLIVFLFFSTEYETLGILFTASFALSLIFTYIAGKLGDDGNVVKILKLGGVVNSVVWVGRMFINGVTSLFFVESFGGVTKPFWIVPVGHYFYERALKSKNLLEYILFKEFIVCVGAILFFVLLILFQDILVAPVISAIAGLLFLFV